jgi:hypothetical protein
MMPRTATARRVLPGSPFNTQRIDAAPAEVFELHDRVNHDRYGLGTVVGTEEHFAVLVDFGSETRRISLPSSKLIKL